MIVWHVVPVRIDIPVHLIIHDYGTFKFRVQSWCSNRGRLRSLVLDSWSFQSKTTHCGANSAIFGIRTGSFLGLLGDSDFRCFPNFLMSQEVLVLDAVGLSFGPLCRPSCANSAFFGVNWACFGPDCIQMFRNIGFWKSRFFDLIYRDFGDSLKHKFWKQFLPKLCQFRPKLFQVGAKRPQFVHSVFSFLKKFRNIGFWKSRFFNPFYRDFGDSQSLQF